MTPGMLLKQRGYRSTLNIQEIIASNCASTKHIINMNAIMILVNVWHISHTYIQYGMVSGIKHVPSALSKTLEMK